jgi:RimJ/RimL family protein N-acetyltransferase
VEPPARGLSDGVVSLRPADERDIDAIERGIADPDVVRWFGVSTLSASAVLRLNRARWQDGTGSTFAICGPDNGCLGLVWLNRHSGDDWTVGYWLLPEARGQGLATRAVRLIGAWAFRDLGVTEVRLVTDPANVASQRVAERGGYRRNGGIRSTIDADGRRVDRLDYVLAPPEAVEPSG